MTAEAVEQLVRDELAAIRDDARRRALVDRLVPVSCHTRGWAFGQEAFRCWVVARDDERDLLLVYVDRETDDPWAYVDAGSKDLGNDGQWFASLDDAFIGGMWDGPLPPDYEVA